MNQPFGMISVDGFLLQFAGMKKKRKRKQDDDGRAKNNNLKRRTPSAEMKREMKCMWSDFIRTEIEKSQANDADARVDLE